MSIALSDKKLDLSVEQLTKDFHDDISCIVERYIPEMMRSLRPQAATQSATLGEMQHCISILLYHAASKAQAIHYRAGLRAMNACFKHFMYLCSHVDNITPHDATAILQAIDTVLTDAVKIISPIASACQKDLSTINDPHLESLTAGLNHIIETLIKKKHA